MAPTVSKAFVAVLFLSSLALCQTTAAAPSSKDKIVSVFAQVTTLSANLRVTTQSITLLNAPLQGYTIGQGFAQIVSTVAAATSAMDPNASPLSDADAKIVVDALKTFVQVHQQLLNVVIGKHGLLTLLPFFEPIRQALVSVEATVDAFALTLIAVIPTQKTAANAQFASLGVTIDAAIQVYAQPL